MRAAFRTTIRTAALAFAAVAATLVVPSAATAQAAPQEVAGQINGKAARLVAQGDDVLISVAEAERLGIDYRQGKSVTIGGTPLWLVTLGSVTSNGSTRINAPAGVVPSIAGYFEALRTHPAEAVARSRETQAEINGVVVKAYDLGDLGVLVSPAEADRAGLKYREGRQQNVGQVEAWKMETVIKVGAEKEASALVTVAEPLPYFEALIAGAGKGR
jgi:hypothetical protein